MTADVILRSIIANASDYAIVKRAATELRREYHSPERLCSIYNLAMSDPEANYPPDVISAMKSHLDNVDRERPENKTVTVRFRCSQNEMNMIQLLADRAGLSVSEFIRRRCLSAWDK